ncbi:ribonuclease H-like domain-containing protein [Tanacetum coccineum]
MADFVPGRAVIDAAQRKRGKNMAKCATIGYGFLSFSFSRFGELEADAVALLQQIRKFSMAQDIGARAIVHIFNRISFAIAKRVGAQIVSQLPSNLFQYGGSKTWTSVPRPEGANIVRCMWLFRHKFLADGTLSRYKARLVANGSTQVEGVDVDETFSPVVKPGTIRTVLSLVISRHWPRSLYGLKQAPRAWFQRFAAYITTVGFTPSRCDSSLFIYRQGDDTTFLLLYVDDIVLTASSDLTCDSSGMFLSQRKYAMEILERAHMVGCNSSRTPVDTESKLGDGGTPVVDPTLYRSLAGSLQYLTFTRPDITYAVQQVCLYMHDPREPHFSALKRILRYVQGTLDYGLQLFSSTTDSLIAYSDADWAGCPTTRRSTSGYCVFLGNNLLSWSSKRQPTLSRSSAEAEYRGVANAVAETCWIRNLLRELHTPLSSATIVYCDNVSAVYLSSNPVQHQRTKHIEIDIHFVRDLVATGQVRVLHVPSRFQYADIFTKGLPSALFEEFRTCLSVRCPSAPTAGECGGIEQNQFDSLVELVRSVTIVPSADRWNWNLESTGIFSVASARRRIDEICLPNIGEETRWVKCVPIKINVLAWKIKTDALPTRFNISRRGIDIQDMSCPICDNAIESTDHLFFRCGLVRDIANKVLSWWNLDHANLNSYAEWKSWLVSIRMDSKLKKMFEGVWYSIWWYVWIYRNKLLFDERKPSKSMLIDNVIASSFYWCKYRSKASFGWNEWLKNPYIIVL